MANDIIQALVRMPRRQFGKPAQKPVEAIVQRDITADELKDAWARFKGGERPEPEVKMLGRKQYMPMIDRLQSGIVPWGGEYAPDNVWAVKLPQVTAYLKGMEPTTPFHFKADWEDAMTGGKPGCAILWGDVRRLCVVFTTKMAVVIDPAECARVTEAMMRDRPMYSLAVRRAMVL